MNKRGVGILIKHSLSFSVLGEERDAEDNLLCLRVDFEGKELIICSIYGPNQVTPTFFTSLQNSISRLATPNTPIIIGGDWNCTVNCSPADTNIDILNMNNPPNLRHSQLLKKMCEDLDLSDPYRVKFPLKRDYTFFNKDDTRNGRSRLDFFVVSNSIIGKIRVCNIVPHFQNKMFDHRAVTISFKDPAKVISQPTVSRELLTDPDLEIHVALAVADHYLIHSAALTDIERTRLSQEIGTAKQHIRSVGPDNIFFQDGLVRTGK
jgi:exonuclease III